MRQLNRVLLIGAMLSVSACWSKFQGTYKDPNAVEIIDEYWNETDARQTAEVLINEMLSRPWLNNFKGEKKAKPIVITKDTENNEVIRDFEISYKPCKMASFEEDIEKNKFYKNRKTPVHQ